jgi:hypothetical protein
VLESLPFRFFLRRRLELWSPGGCGILLGIDVVFGLGFGLLLGLPSALVQQGSP